MFSKSLFNCFSISSTILFWKTRHTSSAYKNRLHFIAISKSSTSIKNNKGPSMDPCVTLSNMLEIMKKTV